jgi:hypothetical protein
MSNSQLKEVTDNPLFNIGIHTLIQTALASHDEKTQSQEI